MQNYKDEGSRIDGEFEECSLLNHDIDHVGGDERDEPSGGVLNAEEDCRQNNVLLLIPEKKFQSLNWAFALEMMGNFILCNVHYETVLKLPRESVSF